MKPKESKAPKAPKAKHIHVDPMYKAMLDKQANNAKHYKKHADDLTHVESVVKADTAKAKRKKDREEN